MKGSVLEERRRPCMNLLSRSLLLTETGWRLSLRQRKMRSPSATAASTPTIAPTTARMCDPEECVLCD
jgi:hypothetical protein